jgi:hypothetical protein
MEDDDEEEDEDEDEEDIQLLASARNQRLATRAFGS